MVLVLDKDMGHAESVCLLVSRQGHQVRHLESWEELGPPGEEQEVLLVDLDSVAADDRRLAAMAGNGPLRVLMTMSSHRHHPHLGESMQRHVFAALRKPLDPEELGFWLRSISRMK